MTYELETNQHLFQPVRYHSVGGTWSGSYLEAAQSCGKPLIWDSAAVLSILSFGYACGNRTLLQGISRQPWLSDIQDAQVTLGPIQPHNLYWQTPDAIAEHLHELLQKEFAWACNNFENIFVLLSGGLDSRIVAGILGNLYSQGLLTHKPIAVTWGKSHWP